MNTDAIQACGTCYGQGVASSDLAPCADCGGVGRLPGALVLTERRLRELEQSYGARGGETESDVRWLVGEVRRAQHALVQILAASQDADDDDAIATKIKFLANDVLHVYPKRPA